MNTAKKNRLAPILVRPGEYRLIRKQVQVRALLYSHPHREGDLILC